MKIHALLGEMRVCCRGNGPPHAIPNKAARGGSSDGQEQGWLAAHTLTPCACPNIPSFPTFHRAG